MKWWNLLLCCGEISPRHSRRFHHFIASKMSHGLMESDFYSFWAVKIKCRPLCVSDLYWFICLNGTWICRSVDPIFRIEHATAAASSKGIRLNCSYFFSLTWERETNQTKTPLLLSRLLAKVLGRTTCFSSYFRVTSFDLKKTKHVNECDKLISYDSVW